jgi:hypothetical protein
VPAHEDWLPGYGEILLSRPLDRYPALAEHGSLLRPRKGQQCHRFCDGRASFMLRGPGAEYVFSLHSRPLADELDLFSFRDDILFRSDGDSTPADPNHKDLMIVRRQAGSCTTTVLARRAIATWDGLAWHLRPYQYDYFDRLRGHSRSLPWEEADRQMLKSAFRIAVHLLSPMRCGATLVLLSRSDQAVLDGLVESSQLLLDRAMRPRDVTITQRAHQRPLVHAISQMDGACLVEPNGKVSAVGAWFAVGLEQDKAEKTGTRHATARSFSALIGGLVIAVSSDGPISLYRGGKLIPDQ